MSGSAARYLPLEDFCITGSGGTPSRSDASFYGGDIPWVKSGELRESVIHLTQETITEEALRKSAAKLVPAGAILLAMYGATVGRLALLGVDAATNQAICNIRPDPKVADSKYVYRALEAKVPELVAQATGGAQPNISQEKVRKTRIPLPPLSEQKRIATILDKADQLRQKRRQAIALLDSLTQSIFLEMFGDPVSNPKRWTDHLALSDVAEIGSGITKGRPARGQSTRSVPYLAVINVQDRALNLSVVKEIEATDDEISRYRLMKNDLLVTEGGDPDKLGRGTLWSEELPEAIHQNHIFRIRFTDARVRPLFASWLIGSERGKKYFLRSAKQTTGIASINKTQLSSFPMLLPPADLQLEFEEKAANVIAKQKSVDIQSRKMDSLFASLQHRAFTGQL